MNLLKVVTAPNPFLEQKALPINSVNQNIKRIIDNMLEIMYCDGGVGLAANQVGILKRIITIDLQQEDDEQKIKGFYPLLMVNPNISILSKEIVNGVEGCLSVPDERIIVPRHLSIRVKYLDYNNKPRELNATNWLARVIQHEVDHLNGIILLDYLSSLKRDIAIRKLTKLKKLSLSNKVKVLNN